MNKTNSAAVYAIAKANEGLDRRIGELEEQLKCYQWIPVEERLPKEGINPVTQDAYVYPVTVDFGNVRDVRYYSFCRGHWYCCGPNPLDDIVIAWMPRPEPFGQQNEDLVV